MTAWCLRRFDNSGCFQLLPLPEAFTSTDDYAQSVLHSGVVFRLHEQQSSFHKKCSVRLKCIKLISGQGFTPDQLGEPVPDPLINYGEKCSFLIPHFSSSHSLLHSTSAAPRPFCSFPLVSADVHEYKIMVNRFDVSG